MLQLRFVFLDSDGGRRETFAATFADGAKGRFKTASGGGIANSWIPNP
jgi:hypothetical protein